MESKWISVEDKPKKSGWYLCYDPNSSGQNKIDVYWYDDYNDSWFWGADCFHPSHYTPLPEPPKS